MALSASTISTNRNAPRVVRNAAGAVARRSAVRRSAVIANGRSADAPESATDRTAIGRRRALAALVSMVPASMLLSGEPAALADEEEGGAPAAAVEDVASAPEASSTEVAAEPEAVATPVATDEGLSARERAARLAEEMGNSRTPRRVETANQPAKMGGGEEEGSTGLILGVAAVSLLGAAGFGAFKLVSGGDQSGGVDESGEYEDEEEDASGEFVGASGESVGKSGSGEFVSKSGDETAGVEVNKSQDVARSQDPSKSQDTVKQQVGKMQASMDEAGEQSPSKSQDFAAALSAKRKEAAAALNAKREEVAEAAAAKREELAAAREEAAAAAAERKEEAAAAKEEAAAAAAERKDEAAAAVAAVAATKLVKREAADTSDFPTSTVRMPARSRSSGDDGEETSLLPRGFPSAEDLAACETAEEKEELCDKADVIVAKLEAKADDAEAFVDGPVVSFLFFIKANAIRNAEKSRAIADEAAAAAAALRRPAGGLGGGAAIASGDDVDGSLEAPVAAKTEYVKKAPKERIVLNTAAPEVKADRSARAGPYGVEAADIVGAVTSGGGDALAAYEALQRK
eukprot:CAMPEP_0181391898 /NCGR_PEP_ID=MMETSP1106-20121128/26293_1 /TAXON_ID=81844 /ORGANISM="Mantoniella antarctica, Strain SL-175" /LENGTH=573 /DNA_ID=CAMNT_0023512965 /DNA_START=195 /DNA_END=1916 /DNA_ORIENTATION=+